MSQHIPRLAAAAAACALAAAVLSGCGQKAAPGAAAMPPTQVEVQTVELTTAVVHADLTGRTSAYQIAEVRPQVSGILQKRLFHEGATVKKGEQLYQIDPAMYQASVQAAEAQLAQARAQLRLAEANARRSSELVRRKAVSEQSDDQAQAAWQSAKADVLAAQASLRTARINLQYTRVDSPITGRASLSEVTPGALVTANQSQVLTTVTQTDPIYVDVTQSYTDLEKLRRDIESGKYTALADGSAEVTLLTEDGQAYPARGRLTFRDQIVDPAKGTVRLRAEFANPDGILYPGMYVRVQLRQAEQRKVALVDQRAVMHDSLGNASVYVVGEGDKVESRQITAENMQDTDWIVEKGLAAGDRVIVEGITKVRPGMPVKPVPAQPAALGRSGSFAGTSQAR